MGTDENKIIFEFSKEYKRLFIDFGIFIIIFGLIPIYIFLDSYYQLGYVKHPKPNIWDTLGFAALSYFFLYFARKLFRFRNYRYILDDETITFQNGNKKYSMTLNWKDIKGIKIGIGETYYFRDTHEWLCAKKIVYTKDKKCIPIYKVKDYDKFKDFVLSKITLFINSYNEILDISQKPRVFELTISFKRARNITSIIFILLGVTFCTWFYFIPRHSVSDSIIFLLLELFLLYAFGLVSYVSYRISHCNYIIDQDSITYYSKYNPRKSIKLLWKDVQGILGLQTKVINNKILRKKIGNKYPLTHLFLFTSSYEILPIYPVKNQEQFKQMILSQLGPNHPAYRDFEFEL